MAATVRSANRKTVGTTSFGPASNGISMTPAEFDRAEFETGWRYELIRNFAYFVHSRNPGIAFGVLSDSPSPWTRVLLITGSVIVIAALGWLFVAGHTGGRMTAAGLALLLGGAAGNVTDRIVRGAVTDFFELWFGSYHYPAFNVADSAIAIGAALVILDVLSHKHHPAELSDEQPS